MEQQTIIAILLQITVLIPGFAALFAQNNRQLLVYTSAFSSLSSILYLTLNSPDVSITEASVGACLTTIFTVRTLRSLHSDPGDKVVRPSFALIIISGLFAVPLVALLRAAFVSLPHFGSENAILAGAVPEFYLEKALELLAFPNLVTAVLAHFRGFDTLIESLVILTAGISVYAIVTNEKVREITLDDQEFRDAPQHPEKNMVLPRITTKIILPIIFLFGFYVQAHGEVSPGGGFQSGSIIACGFIACALLIDERRVKALLRPSRLIMLAAVGCAIYFVVGLVPLVQGYNFLDHSKLMGTPTDIDQVRLANGTGIFLAELGVGLTVFSVMSLIFLTLNIDD